MLRNLFRIVSVTFFAIISFNHSPAQTNYDHTKIKPLKLDRGLVAIRQSADSVALSWRYLPDDKSNIKFNVYRDGEKINSAPIANSTYFNHYFKNNDKPSVYEVRNAANNMTLGTYVLPANAPIGYIDIPIFAPSKGITPAGEEYHYTANDASVGDVDGDGRYEIILKWEPSNAHDNAHDGYTGNVIFDCYTLDGKQLWRIDLGRNIRAGAHYTQFMVYDLDGDGKAEIVMKTADGTIDGKGNIIGDSNADYRYPGDPSQPAGDDFPKDDPRGRKRRNAPLKNQGRILSGPEYLTVFDGLTGEAKCTVKYIPPRGILDDWGDNRANRSDRFLAAVGYLDGERPSVIMCRGYYTRSVLAAYDWDGEKLTTRWVFDSDYPGFDDYAGQGNHNLRVIDVDGDGCDEIIYGQCAIDHNGRGLYSTRMGHGDAMHVTSFIPNDNSLQLWGCHENRRDGSTFRNAATGEVYWQVKNHQDVGRCMAADIDPTNPGLEMWSSDSKTHAPEDGSGGIRNYKGEIINTDLSTISMNSAVWWDGDLLRELLDKNYVTKYDWNTGKCRTLQTFDGAVSNNWTKANACLSGDILGDWREEVILRTPDESSLRVYVSTIPTDYRFYPLTTDIPYRLCLVTQNVAYNQPPHLGFYFGSDLKKGSKVLGTKIR